MKKFLLFAASAMLVLPVFTACSGPSGKPKKDAESLKGLFKDAMEDSLKIKEKEIEILEYYADKKDKTSYDEFKDKQLPYALNDATYEFKKDNRERLEELDKREKDALEKLLGSSDNSSVSKDEANQNSQNSQPTSN